MNRYMYIYICICIYTYLCIYIHIYICIYIYIYLYICIYTYICIYIGIYIYIYIYLNMYVCIHMYINMFAFCFYTYIQVHEYTYAYKYMNKHTHVCKFFFWEDTCEHSNIYTKQWLSRWWTRCARVSTKVYYSLKLAPWCSATIQIASPYFRCVCKYTCVHMCLCIYAYPIHWHAYAGR